MKKKPPATAAYPLFIVLVFALFLIFTILNAQAVFARNHPDPVAARESATLSSFLLIILIYMTLDYLWLGKLSGWKKKAATVAGVIFILLGTEGLMQLWAGANPLPYLPSRQLLWKLAPDMAGVPGGSGRFRVWSDRYGFRTGPSNSHRELIPRKKDRLRVLIIGDSTLFGWPLDYENTFAGYLEKGGPDGKKIQVINCAVPGYSSLQGAMFLDLGGWDLKPDVLVVGFNNDVFLEPVSDEARFKAADRSPLVYYLYRSVLFRVTLGLSLEEKIKPLQAGKGNNNGVPRLSSGEMESVYRELITGARKRGVRVIVLSLPLSGAARDFPLVKSYREIMKKAAANGGVHFLDFYNMWPRPGPDFVDPVHPGPETHRLMAQRVLEILEDKKEK